MSVPLKQRDPHGDDENTNTRVEPRGNRPAAPRPATPAGQAGPASQGGQSGPSRPAASGPRPQNSGGAPRPQNTAGSTPRPQSSGGGGQRPQSSGGGGQRPGVVVVVVNAPAAVVVSVPVVVVVVSVPVAVVVNVHKRQDNAHRAAVNDLDNDLSTTTSADPREVHLRPSFRVRQFALADPLNFK